MEGHLILWVHLNLQPARWEVLFYEHTAWQHVGISEFARLDPVEVSVLCGNIQGLHRTWERPVTKSDELVDAMAIGHVTVLLVQEAWAPVKKPSKRSPQGFWSKVSQHQHRGQGNEISVNSGWCKFLMVIMNEPFALLLLVTSVMGTGVIGSVHMAQRKSQAEFQQQVVLIVSALENIPYVWALVGGDWNRNIRVDKHMQVILYRIQMTVAAMGNVVDLPKDFMVVYGILGPTRSFWFKKVGNQPLVRLQGSQSPACSHTGALTRPVTPVRWPSTVKTVFCNVSEALSQGCSDSVLWLHLYRECVCPGNQIVEGVERNDQPVKGRQEFRDILKDMQIVVMGQGWAQADKRQQRQLEPYWRLLIRDWKSVSGTGLQGNTLRLLKLKKSSPYKVVHTVLDTSSCQLATGLEVLRVAPQQCGNKYRPRARDMPDEWLPSLGLRAEEWQPQYGMGLLYYSAWLSRRGVLPNLDQILQDWGELNNKTPSVVGMVVSLIIHFGLHTMQKLLRLLGTPLRDWPPESRQALHLVLHKKDGYDLNKDSRPIRLLSALLAVLAKLLCTHLQHAVRAPVSGGDSLRGTGVAGPLVCAVW